MTVALQRLFFFSSYCFAINLLKTRRCMENNQKKTALNQFLTLERWIYVDDMLNTTVRSVRQNLSVIKHVFVTKVTRKQILYFRKTKQ